MFESSFIIIVLYKYDIKIFTYIAPCIVLSEDSKADIFICDLVGFLHLITWHA